ncbi:MAG TPA: YtxH domain-containing protein [bacterium]|jgi:gas vesicle protein|nr:YtxH domain-containing protein [bacterium]
MESGKVSVGTVLLALLGGAVVGAAAALLYAPQSGRRTRQRLREFGGDAGDCARDLLSKTEEYLEEARQKTERCLEDAMNKTEQCLEDARSKGEEWLHKGHGCAVEKRQQAAEAAQASR